MRSEIAEASEEAFRQLLCDPLARDFLLGLYCQACVGQLVPGTVHQLRNPLNALFNGAQLMDERGGDESMRAKLLPVMLRSSQRMGEILDAIDPNLDEHAPYDLHLVVETSLRLLRSQTMGVEMKFEKAAATLPVQGELHSLQAMVLSLLQRHLACRPKGIHLRLSATAEMVELCIANEQARDRLEDTGLAALMQASLANALGGSLTCSATTASSRLLLRAEFS